MQEDDSRQPAEGHARHHIEVHWGRAVLVAIGAIVFSAIFYQFVEPVLYWIAARVSVNPAQRGPMLEVSRVAGGVLGFIVGAGIGNLVQTGLMELRRRWDNLP